MMQLLYFRTEIQQFKARLNFSTYLFKHQNYKTRDLLETRAHLYTVKTTFVLISKY